MYTCDLLRGRGGLNGRTGASESDPQSLRAVPGATEAALDSDPRRRPPHLRPAFQNLLGAGPRVVLHRDAAHLPLQEEEAQLLQEETVKCT